MKHLALRTLVVERLTMRLVDYSVHCKYPCEIKFRLAKSVDFSITHFISNTNLNINDNRKTTIELIFKLDQPFLNLSTISDSQNRR